MTDEHVARNARREADLVVGPEMTGVVLEPSPPAVATAPWFADDPVDAGGAHGSVVVPRGLPGDISWDDWLGDHPDHEGWVARRWLGGGRRLPPPPPGLERTRTALHRLAAHVIAPARHRSVGRFGLRWTLGGFGTPFFDDDRQIRVEGSTLVDQRGATARAVPITTLAAGADFLGTSIDARTAAEHDTPPPEDLHEALDIDHAGASYLGEWFGMAVAALEAFRADDATVDPTRPQLWPGHFDPAIDAGTEQHRATYGASPGDAAIAEPYLYVSVWWPDRAGVDSSPAWDAPGFTGRVLRASELGDGDPADTAVAFWSTTRDLLR